MSFTFDDMLRFATEAWGPLGTRTVHMWRVVRINVDHPETGLPSPTQMQISRWPHDQPLINLGRRTEMQRTATRYGGR
jgi:hypothetical protein